MAVGGGGGGYMLIQRYDARFHGSNADVQKMDPAVYFVVLESSVSDPSEVKELIEDFQNRFPFAPMSEWPRVIPQDRVAYAFELETYPMMLIKIKSCAQ
jgi:hypothetical protein